MSKMELKQLLCIIFISVLNICITYAITVSLNIQNIILYKSLTAIQFAVTYEVIIFILLSSIEAIIYHFKYET